MAAPRSRRESRVGLYEDADYVALVTLIGSNVRRLRFRRKWTLEQASSQCGMTPNNFSPLEQGKTNVTALTLSRVAKGFGVEPWELLATQRAVRPASENDGYSDEQMFVELGAGLATVPPKKTKKTSGTRRKAASR